MQKLTSAFVLLSLFSHLFCCVLPVVMSVVGLGAAMGLVTLNIPGLEFFVAFEVEIMVGAGILLAMGALLQIVSYRIDCRKVVCEHEPCAPKKKLSQKIFAVSLALYSINLVIFTLLPHSH